MTDFIIRFVEGYGYLPLIETDGKETYRGEYQSTPYEALERCVRFYDNKQYICKGCKQKGSTELHTCPYRGDVGNDYETKCRCCSSCQDDCEQEI